MRNISAPSVGIACAAALAAASLAGCISLPNLSGPGAAAAANGLLDLSAYNYANCTQDPSALNATPVGHPIPALKPSTPTDLYVAGHDSMAFSPAMVDEFNKTYNARVHFLMLGDAGTATTKVILERNEPPADVFFGVDNSLIVRAEQYGIFQPYHPLSANVIPSCLQFDRSWNVTPLDYGFVTVVYDKAALARAGVSPPSSLEDLTKPQWKGKLVVESPTASSTGLAFLLMTIRHFGESGNYTVWDYWRDLVANKVVIVSDWNTAYYQKFSKYGGPCPLVVSYTTDPAAEISGTNLTTSPVGDAPIPDGAYLQIEGIGILAHAKHVQLAKAFIEFALSRDFQQAFTNLMWVFPANAQAQPDPSFKYAQIPPRPSVLNPHDVNANESTWLDLWTNVAAAS
jgi:thiamine transport system substrate-binding protein